MSAFPGVSSYQSSSPGSKFVVIGVVCCQEMRHYALFHKVLPGLTKYLNRACFVTSNRLKDKQYGLKYGRIGARELGKGKEKACSYGGGADV